VKRTAKKNNPGSKAIQLREWRVTLMRYRGELLGYVEAASLEAAEIAAAKQFSLSEFQRKRLLLQEHI
jgi:hypothetical protein